MGSLAAIPFFGFFPDDPIARATSGYKMLKAKS
jgi:hypothetical protein